MKFTISLLIACSVFIGPMAFSEGGAHTDGGAHTIYGIDPTIALCYGQLRVGAWSDPAYAPNPEFEGMVADQFGRKIAMCLQQNGYSEKVNPRQADSDIIDIFAEAKFGAVNLAIFNSIVSSVLRRP